MYEVTAAAGVHQATPLRNYHGKRENPHGHNYNLKVTLVGESLNQAGAFSLTSSCSTRCCSQLWTISITR